MEQPKASSGPPAGPAPWSRAGWAVRLATFAAAYVAVAQVGLLFQLPDSIASPIWPPAGLAIAFAVLWRNRVLPGVFAGALVVEMLLTRSVGASLLMAAGSTGEAALGGWLARRAGGRDAFRTLPGVLGFAAALLVGAVPAATAGVAALALLGSLPEAGATAAWWTWFLGDAAGAFVVAPVLLLARQLRPEHWSRRFTAEALGVAAALAAVALVVFRLVPAVDPGDLPLIFLLMPPLVWAAFRVGPAATSVLVMALDVTAIAVTKAGLGPFAGLAPNATYVAVQAFMFIVGGMVLALAGAASERQRTAGELERRVIERTGRLEEVNGLLRREVEERKAVEAQASGAQHIARLGYWTWDVTQPNAVWSDELYRIYGLDPRTHTPSYADYLTRIHPDDVERVKAATEAAFRDRKAYSHDERIRHTDGSWRDLHTWAQAVVDADGKLTHLVGVCQDITARVATERALQESLERFRALAEASPIGIVHATPTGSVDYANQAWISITGLRDYTDDAAVARAIHPEDQPAMRRLWDECVAGNREFVAEMRWRRPDGTVRLTSCRAVPVLDAAGRLTGFVSTVEDITDRRAAEAKDREVRRLREQAEFKTNFLRTAAHELGTPLTPIKIQMHILRDLLRAPAQGDGTRDDERKAAEILDRNIRRLQVLVQDMLESARLQSGRLRLAVRPMDMAQVVHEVVETFQEPAIQTGVVLDTEGPHELPMVGDPDRLSQVLYNLLSNAMKFTPSGGRIHVTLAQEGDRVRLTVRDTGAGFTAEQGAQLFQPFTQLHDPMQRTRGGSGLGLYISRGIVEQHGGRLVGESAGPGLGATFTFTVPLASPVTAPAAGSADLEGQPVAGTGAGAEAEVEGAGEAQRGPSPSADAVDLPLPPAQDPSAPALRRRDEI